MNRFVFLLKIKHFSVSNEMLFFFSLFIHKITRFVLDSVLLLLELVTTDLVT